MADFRDFMLIAIDEARVSFREGNCGFGAVIVKDGEIVSRSHDTEKTERDPTAHAELTAIRKAATLFGRHLDGCQVISTHEPCPMCATATVWAGIETVAYGYSIREALEQGRRRIDLPCREIFDRAGKKITIHENVLHDQCSVLYHEQVRKQIDMLRDADETAIHGMANALIEKRLAWIEANRPNVQEDGGDLLGTAYRLLIQKLGILPEQAPILDRGQRHLRFASRNFCPTLEACRILGLDTRFVCKHLTERPTNEFLRQIHTKLRFSRNYETLRPYGDYCEETISLEE